jgi:hypothetical protein
MFARILASIGALLMAAHTPAALAAPDLASAEKLRKLDIMLMVTALWCRHTPYGFQDDYYRFSARHLAELNQSAGVLRASLVSTYGDKGADRALDRMSVVIANRFGQGHPSMNCQQLQSEVRSLAGESRPGALLSAASRLLPDGQGVQLAFRP